MKQKIFTLILALFLITLSANTFSEPRRVLLEFCTGTWCGYCPCGDSIIEHHILPQFPQTIVLAYHGPSNNSIDPYRTFNGNNIIDLIGYTGYPLAIFDRQSGAPMDFDFNWPDTCAVRYSRTPNSNISIVFTSKNYDAGTRTLTAAINSTALQNLTGQYKITYVVTENNLVYPQTSYALCGYNGTLTNYLHKWIVRNIVNGATGENLNTGTWNQNQVITKNVSTVLDPSWVAANCNLVVFVYADTPPIRNSTVEQSNIQSVTNPLGVNGTSEVPKKYSLSQNYPNPFNPTSNIKFSLPEDGSVSLKVYDVLGNEVKTLVEGNVNKGIYNAEFDGSDLSSGIYFYTLKTSKFTETKKMLMVK